MNRVEHITQSEIYGGFGWVQLHYVIFCRCDIGENQRTAEHDEDTRVECCFRASLHLVSSHAVNKCQPNDIMRVTPNDTGEIAPV